MKEIILIVDDDKDDIENFKDHILELQAEYRVESEEDFSNTIKKITDIRACGNKVAAIFIDLIRKDNGNIKEVGLNTITSVKEKFDDILIVSYTQYGTDYFEKAQDCGADCFFRKQELKQKMTLNYLKDRIKRHNEGHKFENTHYNDWLFNLLLQVLNNTHTSMSKITDINDRYDRRNNIIQIKDEYDLQDLFWVILKPIFPAMVKEFQAPTHMGKSSRADFYIPEIKTILELKHVRSGSQAKEISEQLDHDITWYALVPGAENIIFYIFKGNNIFYDFNPIIMGLGKENYLREPKTWRIIKCLVHPL